MEVAGQSSIAEGHSLISKSVLRLENQAHHHIKTLRNTTYTRAKHATNMCSQQAQWAPRMKED